MRCKYCGGEINLSVGRCIGCGSPVDDTADIRILHDLEALTEKYGLDPEDIKYSAGEAVGGYTILDQRTSAGPAPFDLKTAVVPGIKLETYYQLLGDGMQYGDAEEQTEILIRHEDMQEERTLLLAADDAEQQETEETDSAADTVSAAEEGAPPAGLVQRAERFLDRLDELTAPITERIREWYNAKMPRMNRAQSSSKWERLAVVGAAAAAFVLVIVVISLIISSIPDSVKGEWRVGDENAESLFTVEFTGSEVIARVYDPEGEEHIYKTGTYDVSRKNGMDLLTITYDDGGLSHLYYKIDGRTGEFVNVDTGSSDRYERID